MCLIERFVRIFQQQNQNSDTADFYILEPATMESLKTQYPPNIAEPRAFEVQSAKEEKRRRSVSTPVPPRPNRPNSTGKMLELTPLWDQLQRYNRLPQNVEAVKVFSELSLRLEDPEWEVRLHALRVLVDLLPAVAGANSDDIDALMIPVVLTAVINNLGHTSPSVRKGTLEVLGIYIKHSADSEYVLRCIVSQGLESPAASGNLIMSVINGLPYLLQQTIRQQDKTSNRQSISHQSLVHLVTALSKKLLQTNSQKQAVNSLMAIKELVGENRFYHLLESYYPQVKRDLEVLCKVYEIRASNSNINDSGIDLQGSVENSPASIQKQKDRVEEDDWSETMTMSPVGRGISPKTRLELNRTPILDDESEDTMRYDGTPRSQEETPRFNETPRSMDTSQYLDTPRSQDTITTHETQTPRYQCNQEISRAQENRYQCNQEISRAQENKDMGNERRDHQYGHLGVKVTEDEDDEDVDEEEEEGDEDEEEEEVEEDDYEEDVKRGLNPIEQDHDDDNDVAVKRSNLTDSQNKPSDIERFFGECTGSFDAAGNGGRVVMETEIKFDEDTAITMTILEEKEIERRKKIAEENGNVIVGKENCKEEVVCNDPDRFINDFVMKVLEDEEAELEGKKVQRRVRFGGEVIKLRTPDSDITIEVAQSDSSGDQGGGSKGNGRIVESTTDESTAGESSPKQPPNNDENFLQKKKDCEGGDERRPRSSHIPLPIVPATHRPQDPRRKRRQRSKSPGANADPFDFSIPNCDGGESLTSSSEGEQHCRLAESRIPRDEWHRLGFIDGSVMDNILNKDDWRGRVRSLDRLALALRQAEFSRYLATVGQRGGLALLSFLLRSLHDDRSQRLVSSSLRAARSLIQVLPVGCVHSTLTCLVPSFCRHLGGGGSGSVMVKLEAIAALKSLMRIVRPAPIVDILFGDKCFGSRSSKQRESALLCLMYSLMIFPSTEFSCARLANWIVRAASREPKRRVRQSILETLAVLAQFVPRSQLKVDIGEYPPSERDEAAIFADALHARLSRKLLPTVSPEGLILYAIQLPPTLTGADIEWIMRGSGSVSAGSAKNRTQLDNAQRAFNSPPQTETPSSSGSWRSQDMMAVGVAMNGGRHLNNSMLVYPSNLDEQKSNFDVGWGDSRHNTSVSYGVVRPMYLRFQQDSNHSTTLQPDGFSHIAPSYMQSPAYTSRKMLANSAPDLMNQTWPPPQQMQRISNSPGRPIPGRKAEPALDSSTYYGAYVSASPPHVSINPNSLPPLVAASQDWPRAGYHWNPSSSSDNQVQHHHSHHHHMTHLNDGAQRIAYDDQRQNRWTRTPSEPDVYLKKQMGSSGIGGEELTQKPVLARHYGSPQTNGQTAGHQHHGYEAYQTKTGPGSASATNRLHLADNHHRADRQHQERMSHQQNYDTQTNLKRSEFAADSEDTEKTPRLRQQMRTDNENVDHDAVDEVYGEQIIESGSDGTKEKCDTDHDGDVNGCLESPSPPTPPPPPSPTPQLLPPHLHEIHPARQTPLPLDIENYLQLGSKEIVEKNSDKTETVQNICCDGDKISAKQKITRPKMKPSLMKKGAPTKGNGKLDMTTSPSMYPESLPAFDHPKEGLNKCLSHIENNDWEMTVQGMQSMIRLARHHPSLLLPHTHTLAAALSRHIRSLRSQVARASCQATALLFAILGKPLENELEDLAGSLFNRTADTNKFLRGDCTHALDCMVEHISPTKSIPAIISKGAKHQNAVVRTVASRLLAGLCAKLGAERVLSLPKQIRDSILNTGAKLLTEGSLETRKHAKELFSVLSADARLPLIMADVVPNNLMRNISKTLNKLQCNNS